MNKRTHNKWLCDWSTGEVWHCRLCDSVWYWKEHGRFLEYPHCPDCCGKSVWCRKADYVATFNTDSLRVPDTKRAEIALQWGKSYLKGGASPVLILGQPLPAELLCR